MRTALSTFNNPALCFNCAPNSSGSTRRTYASDQPPTGVAGADDILRKLGLPEDLISQVDGATKAQWAQMLANDQIQEFQQSVAQYIQRFQGPSGPPPGPPPPIGGDLPPPPPINNSYGYTSAGPFSAFKSAIGWDLWPSWMKALVGVSTLAGGAFLTKRLGSQIFSKDAAKVVNNGVQNVASEPSAFWSFVRQSFKLPVKFALFSGALAIWAMFVGGALQIGQAGLRFTGNIFADIWDSVDIFDAIL